MSKTEDNNYIIPRTPSQAIDDVLESRGMTYKQLNELLLKHFGSRQRYTEVVVDGVNRETNSYFEKFQPLIQQLEKMNDGEIRKLLDEELVAEDPGKFLFIFHFIEARDAYESMFVNFRKVVADPSHFLPALIDTVFFDFSSRLYVTTKQIGSTRGFIFSLEDNVLPENKMGILLTPLAFASTKQFFQTLFHELAHRLFFAKHGWSQGKEHHEIFAYFLDKFLVDKYLGELNLGWLDEVFELGVFETSQQMKAQTPDFFESTVSKFLPDIHRFRKDISDGKYGESESRRQIGRRCFRASRLLEIPSSYQCIWDFLWLYSTRQSALVKLKHADFSIVQMTSFMLMVLFSEQYESKYHLGNETKKCDNVVFHASGHANEQELAKAKNVCESLRAQYWDENDEQNG